MGWGFWLLCVALAVMFGFAAWGFLAAWKMAGNAPMSVHGYVAMGLGIVLSLLLGGGLMALAFHSSRRGYDDDTGH
jgi:hypothetical protein